MSCGHLACVRDRGSQLIYTCEEIGAKITTSRLDLLILICSSNNLALADLKTVMMRKVDSVAAAVDDDDEWKSPLHTNFTQSSR